ncbi:MAG: aldo/keto reductase, partial [Thermodesulfobacteriota bacterium]|nr:aldo/keto reductase [Thermodesulfobacteriota bacterium]
LERLKRDAVYGFLLHNADDLAAPGGRVLFKAARSLAGEGLVRKIGVSVYTREQIEATLSNYEVDLIQLPISIFDQRLLKSGTLAKLKDRGVEVHARSAFLQGLIFLDPSSLDPYFAPVKERLIEFRRAVERAGAGLVQAALAFLRGIPEIDRIIIGVNTASQLRANIEDYRKAEGLDMDFGAFAIQDERMVNPALWSLS